MDLPPDTVDMSLYFGNAEQKKEFCHKLLSILKTYGCAKVRNHPIPDETISQLFEKTREFFALPLEIKMEAKHPPQANPNRGYSHVGQENIASISGFEREGEQRATKDFKETFDMGGPNDGLVDNQWVSDDKLPGFRQFMESFYQLAYRVEIDLLSALAVALGLTKEQLISRHSKAENEFRLLHYPPVATSMLKDASTTRIAEHTDFGTITMLFQDSVGGLQVEDQTQLGKYRDVESTSATEIILNIGDSLQRLTNDTFKAARHRVTYPATVNLNGDAVIPERYSIAYFAKPNRDSSLLPLTNFIDHEKPCRYTDITAWEWNNMRIAKLYA